MKNTFKKSLDISQYQDAVKYMDIIASVYVETNPSQFDRAAESSFVAQKLCPLPTNVTEGVIGSVDLNSRFMPAQANKHLNVAADRKYYKGVRDVAHVQPRGYLTTATAVDNYNFCAREGLLVEICMRPEETREMIPIVKACPNTTFVFDHCGGAPGLRGDTIKENTWALSMELLAKEPNVIMKISGLAGCWGDDLRVDNDGWNYALQERYVRHCLQCFDDNRVIFGSDWPFCNWVNGGDLLKFIEGVQGTAIEVGGQRLADKVFYRNALNLFKIKLHGSQELKYTPPSNPERYAKQGYISHKWREQTQIAATNKSLLDMYYEETVANRNRGMAK